VRTRLTPTVAAVLACLCIALLGAGSAVAGTMSTPILSCGSSGPDYQDIHVCAGATGAPAGFTLQWMTLADYVANGNAWLSSELGLCDGSFSGNASLSRYNLAPNQCVVPDVRIGDLLQDNGTSTSCPERLQCGTTYVFRGFAHANSANKRSAFTTNLTCTTAPCNTSCDPNVKSFGFWKNHYPDAWPADVIANGLTVGCQTYTAAQLEAILNKAPAGNALIALAHQVINTRLNILNGASAAYVAAVSADLAAAEALMCTTGAVPPVGSGSLSGAAAGGLTLALDGERGQFECADED